MGAQTLLSRVLKRLGVFAPSVIATGPARGLLCDPGRSNEAYATGDNELPVQHALTTNLSAGDVFYDIGANIGFLTILGARIVGRDGTVYAFEPVPSNARYVRKNASANRFAQVRVFEQAISNRVGKGILSLTAYSGGAALDTAPAPPDIVGTRLVDVSTVDDLVFRRGLKPPSFVKIDVEGAELEVLEGMQSVVLRYRPAILLEIDAGLLETLREKKTACEEWLAEQGYRWATLQDSYAGGAWLVTHILATPLPRASANV